MFRAILNKFKQAPLPSRPPRPKLPEWAKYGYEYRFSRQHNRWLLVCTTCGGNCGQCGSTGRFLEDNDGIVVPPSMSELVVNTGMDKPNPTIKSVGKRLNELG